MHCLCSLTCAHHQALEVAASVVPLSLDGLLTAFSIVFMLAMGFFITPALLGGRSDLLLGNLIEQQVGELKWGFAAALAVLLLTATLLALSLGRGIQGAVRRLSRTAA